MDKTLDFKVIFYLLRKKIIYIIIAAIVGGLAAFFITENMIPKKYTSGAQVYISNTQEIGDINTSNILASRSFAETYRIILQSDKANALLKELLGKNEEYNSLPYKNSYSVTVTVTDKSEILKFSVTSRDPEVSRIVCNTMLDVSKQLIADIFDDAGEAHPLGDAKANHTPSSPNIRSNTLMGVIVAMLVMGAFVVVWALLDNRVKDEADFVAKVNIPVLGEVPSIGEVNEGREGYYYYAYTKKEEQQ